MRAQPVDEKALIPAPRTAPPELKSANQLVILSLTPTHLRLHYIYITFTCLRLAEAFIQSDFTESTRFYKPTQCCFIAQKSLQFGCSSSIKHDFELLSVQSMNKGCFTDIKVQKMYNQHKVENKMLLQKFYGDLYDKIRYLIPLFVPQWGNWGITAVN